MSGDLVPVLWLCGPPGVGKTTVGWQIFSQLTQTGIRSGYVDIDQLGICYPEPASDPGRHRMKARNLGAVVATFRAAGVRCVVVSGVVDAVAGVHVDQIPQAALTVCRLRAGHDVLRERLFRRGVRLDRLDAELREADALDRSDFTDLCVDTSGLTVAEVTRLVREHAGGWPVLDGQPQSPGNGADPRRPDGPTVNTTPESVLWLCGATGVGKSSVGWQVWERVRRAGTTAAFVDLDQIGFCRPAPADDPGNDRVKARNLAALWQTYRANGARRLIVVGAVEHPDIVRTYTAALPAATVTLCRLHAGRDHLTQRIMLRGRGGGPPIPGDRLNGQPAAILHRIADEASARADAMERAGIGDLRIDTDGRTIEEIADTVLAHAGPRGDSVDVTGHLR